MAMPGEVINVGFLSLPADIQQSLTEKAAERYTLEEFLKALYARVEQLQFLEDTNG